MDYRITKDVLYEIFDDEVVLINLKSGNYYSLHGLAAEIWSFLENGVSRGGIIAYILRRYQGVRSEITQSISQFLLELSQDELVEMLEVEHEDDNNQASEMTSMGVGTDLPEFVPPRLDRFTDMQDLLLLDPIHDVGDEGWPNRNPDISSDLREDNG